jgi:hypoxanthine-DNA glycosylase
MSFCVSFPPIARTDARVLILGTLPGAESLARQQYYAKPQNSFWRIMGALAGAGPDVAYADRLARLHAHHIAVWDVCASAMREGSLDTAIKDPEINDFNIFFGTHKQIRLVCFNGKHAEKLFDRHVRPTLAAGYAALTYHSLPSTSPAFAGMRHEDKLARWRHALAGAIESGRQPTSSADAAKG